MITYDEIIEETKTVPTNFNEKKQPVKQKKFYILLAFLLTTITNYYKYWAKQKYLLPYLTNNKTKENFYYKNWELKELILMNHTILSL